MIDTGADTVPISPPARVIDDPERVRVTVEPGPTVPPGVNVVRAVGLIVTELWESAIRTRRSLTSLTVFTVVPV